jgi:hypothetical protein
MSEIKLLSAVGVEYTRLRDLLAAKDWLKADDETARLILKVAGKKENGFLFKEDIDKFPCEDLQIIDQLWMYYSERRFGYTLQSYWWEGIQLQYQRKGGFEAFFVFANSLGWFIEGKSLQLPQHEFYYPRQEALKWRCRVNFFIIQV